MKQKGFTLIEMVVVLAVVAILAAILVPTIANNIQDAKIARAYNETQVIAGAMAQFYKDLGRWPTEDGADDNPDDDLYLLFTSDGTNAGPTGSSWNPSDPVGAREDTFDNHLINNTPKGQSTNIYPTTGKHRWRGPYLQVITGDTFGNRYACNIRYIWDTSTGTYLVFVLSPGPDKTWDTNFSASSGPADDDIGTSIR